MAALIIGSIALALSLLLLVLSWRGILLANLIPAGKVAARWPTLALANVSVDKPIGCDGSFSGGFVLKYSYPPPPPQPKMNPTVTLNCVPVDNIVANPTCNPGAVGPINADGQASITFAGKLVDPCKVGSFTIIAAGSGSVAATVNVPAVGFKAPALPPNASMHDNTHFDVTFTPSCCPGAGAMAGNFTIKTTREHLVTITGIAPNSFTCPGGALPPVTISGTWNSDTDTGFFYVTITNPAGDTCQLGRVDVGG